MRRTQFVCSVVVLCFLANTQRSAAQEKTLVITEVYPAPAQGESEWVELYNASNQVATASGWILMDQLSTPSVIHTFDSLEVAPMQIIIAELNSQKLNNSGDSVVLLNAENQVIDQIAYTSSETGYSWHKDPTTNTVFSGLPTKNSILLEPTPTPSPTIAPTPTTSTKTTPTPSATVAPATTSEQSVEIPSPAAAQIEQNSLLEEYFRLPQSVRLSPFILEPTTIGDTLSVVTNEHGPQPTKPTEPIIGIMAGVLAIGAVCLGLYGQKIVTA